MKIAHRLLALCALAVALSMQTPAQSAERWSMSVEQPASNFISRVAVEFARNA